MSWARSAFTYTAYVLGLLVVIQFFLAGWGVANLGADQDALDMHKTFGNIMHGLTLLLVIFALFAKYRGALLGMSIALFVLATLQFVWIEADSGAIRGLHVLGALAIAMVLREIAAKKPDAPATA